MPSLRENLSFWDRQYDWSHQGESWSGAWGNTDLLWYGSLFPRIQRFVPTTRILEIAPGFGRMTEYLRGLCDHLTIVDMSPKCIEACKTRFADAMNIEYHVNDGMSLEAVPARSVDLAFSWDSLVHVEAAVMEAYVSQLGEKLAADGVAFLHHSNVGTFLKPAKRVLPGALADVAVKRVNANWRGEDMTAKLFDQFCANAGLQCIVQELIEWQHPRFLLIDCISTCTRRGSRWARPLAVKRRPLFMREARRLAKLSAVYGNGDAPGRAR